MVFLGFFVMIVDIAINDKDADNDEVE